MIDPSQPSITSRPATPEDSTLVFQIYAGTRLPEIQAFGWNAAQQEGFLRMQFDARRLGYQAQFPAAEHTIVIVSGTPVGSMIVNRGPSEIRLVDIALLPEHRGRGFGTHLLSKLISEAEARQVPLRLSVLRGNPAIHLYVRVGFVVQSEDAMYLEMTHEH